MIRVDLKEGVHSFYVDENLDENRFRIVSCNIAVPTKASCDRDLKRLLDDRMEAKNGQGKGRGIQLVDLKARLIVSVMAVHVHGPKQLVTEIHVDPDAGDGLVYTAVGHNLMCGRRLASHPDMNDGDETFYLAIGQRKKHNRVREAAKSLGFEQIEPWLWHRANFQDLFIYRPNHRAEVVRSRSRAKA